MTVVLGIDPSLTCTGVAMLTWHEGTDFPGPNWSTWRARSQALPKDFPAAEVVPATRRRIRIVLRETLALVPARVDLAVIEGPSRGSKGGMSDERAAVRWFLVDQLLARGPVVVLTPKQRALFGSDDGNADKAKVREAVRAQFPDVHVPDDNVADAVALAAAGAYRLGFPVEYTAHQIKAHARVAWPQETAAA
ncbi:hypothetical protein JNB62_05570 [Microbacterium jejuense]|uniref:Holliday junction nuclease RuvC n=1 Tax=Microbacterium jejuense TaxID=1263637 RepID=A0ABS7HL42_9MICO|nr:hypothetical protein [Microbacterium jejuense]MBW9093145.1 hypothetical protein [Microbacterium jejuense]